jgi:hypothetical protein
MQRQTNLARPFKAGIKSSNHLRVALATQWTQEPALFFNRRYATDDFYGSSYPALKGRAKFITTLRVGFPTERDFLRQNQETK